MNYVIAESLGTIENVLLFSISNYFRKFSLEYKRQHGNIEYFDNDWYDFIEYGTHESGYYFSAAKWLFS